MEQKSVITQSKKQSFPYVSGKMPQVLILGSMPGEESLRQQQYYAHKRNAFWNILGELFGFPRELPYVQRLKHLTEHGIALWDVLAECRREGSLDTRISDAKPNDIPGFLKKYPSIKRILCNGTASYTYLKKHFPELFFVVMVLKMPSTSPASAGISYNQKYSAYRSALFNEES